MRRVKRLVGAVAIACVVLVLVSSGVGAAAASDVVVLDDAAELAGNGSVLRNMSVSGGEVAVNVSPDFLMEWHNNGTVRDDTNSWSTFWSKTWTNNRSANVTVHVRGAMKLSSGGGGQVQLLDNGTQVGSSSTSGTSWDPFVMTTVINPGETTTLQAQSNPDISTISYMDVGTYTGGAEPQPVEETGPAVYEEYVVPAAKASYVSPPLDVLNASTVWAGLTVDGYNVSITAVPLELDGESQEVAWTNSSSLVSGAMYGTDGVPQIQMELKFTRVGEGGAASLYEVGATSGLVTTVQEITEITEVTQVTEVVDVVRRGGSASEILDSLLGSKIGPVPTPVAGVGGLGGLALLARRRWGS